MVTASHTGPGGGARCLARSVAPRFRLRSPLLCESVSPQPVIHRDGSDFACSGNRSHGHDLPSLDQVVLHALPVREPERLVLIDGKGDQASMNAFGSYNLMSYPICRDLQKQDRFFEVVLCRALTTVTFSAGEEHIPAAAEIVSGSYFSVLGINPALGRLFTMDDDQPPHQNAVIVLSYDFWKNQLAGAPDAGCNPGLKRRLIRISAAQSFQKGCPRVAHQPGRRATFRVASTNLRRLQHWKRPWRTFHHSGIGFVDRDIVILEDVSCVHLQSSLRSYIDVERLDLGGLPRHQALLGLHHIQKRGGT